MKIKVWFGNLWAYRAMGSIDLFEVAVLTDKDWQGQEYRLALTVLNFLAMVSLKVGRK